MARFTTTQYEYDRLRLTTENSRHLFVESPKKRVNQIAMEHIDDCRKAARYLLKFPHSTRARRYVLETCLRVANINEQHATESTYATD